MKKVLFSYEENEINVSKFQKLGFNVEFDDNMFYCSLDLSNFDLLNVLSMCDDLLLDDLDVDIIIDDLHFVLSQDYNKIDSLVNKNPLFI